MKMIADENLAFTDYFFSEFGKVEHRGGRHLQHEDVKDADALIIRSVTKVDHTLIDHSALKFVGSATIGTDHMDITALQQQALRGVMHLDVMLRRSRNMSLQRYYI